MAWYGTRGYIGASWMVARGLDGSLTWTQITASNPFPNTIALALSFRNASGALDPRFFATLSVPGLAQTTFVVNDLNAPVPSSTTGWFILTSYPTPIVPMALIYWSQAANNNIEVYSVPIEQLDKDGFPVGDAAAQPTPAEPQTTGSIRRPLATDLWGPGSSTTSTRARSLSSSGPHSPRRARSTRLSRSSTR